MGEAKRRGSYETRVIESTRHNNEKQQVAIVEVLKELGLPLDSAFLGYVIHNPDADDYLHLIEDTPSMTRRLYCPTPEDAMRFDDYHLARATAKKIPKKTLVGLLFDTGDQYAVGFDDA